jgi:thiol-disulfide isomerase/thioredoxin
MAEAQTLNNVKIGDEVDLSSYDLININNSEIYKDKAKILDMWATWCGPCIASFPHLVELQEKFSDQVQIIAISDEAPITTKDFLLKKNIKLSFFNDVDKKLYESLDVQTRPISFLLSPDNKILWVGNSQELDSVLPKYFRSGKVEIEAINTLYSKYYNFKTHKVESKIIPTSFDYLLSESVNPLTYFAKSQKEDDQLLDIEYRSVPFNEIIMDFFQVNELNIENTRNDLKQLLLNIEAKSAEMSYKQGKEIIIEDLKNNYGFTIQKNKILKIVHNISINDIDVLSDYLETVEGGGFVNRKNGHIFITRLNLQQLASYFGSSTNTYFIYDGDNKSKYNIVINEFNNINELNTYLNIYGLNIERINKEIEVIMIE